MAVNSNDAEFLAQITHTKRRRLAELEKQAAVYGISTPPEVNIEIRDLREQLGIVDLIANGKDDWKTSQVGVLVFTLAIAYTDRWNDQDRHNRSQDHLLRVVIGLQIASFVAFIILTVIIMFRGAL